MSRRINATCGYAVEYTQFSGSAVYDGKRDLFVRSPDGRGASACGIWFDPVNAGACLSRSPRILIFRAKAWAKP
jgi:hypothetical protein